MGVLKKKNKSCPYVLVTLLKWEFIVVLSRKVNLATLKVIFEFMKELL